MLWNWNWNWFLVFVLPISKIFEIAYEHSNAQTRRILELESSAGMHFERRECGYVRRFIPFDHLSCLFSFSSAVHILFRIFIFEFFGPRFTFEYFFSLSSVHLYKSTPTHTFIIFCMYAGTHFLRHYTFRLSFSVGIGWAPPEKWPCKPRAHTEKER